DLLQASNPVLTLKNSPRDSPRRFTKGYRTLRERLRQQAPRPRTPRWCVTCCALHVVRCMCCVACCALRGALHVVRYISFICSFIEFVHSTRSSLHRSLNPFVQSVCPIRSRSEERRVGKSVDVSGRCMREVLSRS